MGAPGDRVRAAGRGAGWGSVGVDDFPDGLLVIVAPWARVKVPVPIPEPLNAEAVRQLPDPDLAELVRSHLLPGSERPARRRWETLWAVLGRSEDLRERAEDILDEFLEVTDQALEQGDLDGAAVKRAERFLVLCEDATDRLTPKAGQPLGWAGPGAQRFNRGGRRALDSLVGAIVRHRQSLVGAEAETDHDEDLWAHLQVHRLDPDGNEIDERILRRATGASLPAENAPLEWAGPSAAGFNYASRRVLDDLLRAVAVHRRRRLARGSLRAEDEALWRMVEQQGFDSVSRLGVAE